MFVELGTRSGNSYSAFAQAIQHLDVDAACYSVDTWQGDHQAGSYGNDVFEEWTDFHNRHFSAFSRIVRSTFDEALLKFSDGTIDLLHIDGLHTYDAVRHDFESWLPKLSASAIVLLHDTNVREADFGVWKFWLELKARYPCFEFLHGHGIGVVGVGAELPKDVRWLLRDVAGSGSTTHVVRQYLRSPGRRARRPAPRVDAGQQTRGPRPATRRVDCDDDETWS